MHHRDHLQDLEALLPGRAHAPASRRQALQWALGAGYAAAAAPLVAQTAIQTPAQGLQAGWVELQSLGTTVPAYRAQPAGRSDLPVVLVVQEIFGVHAYIQDVCRRLAHAGYLAIAPQMFARQGDASQYTEASKLMAEVVSRVPDAQAMADLDAALAWAAAHGGDVQRAGITGFCWGGRTTWLYAAQGRVKAGVAWYGRLEGVATPLTPMQPVQLVGQLKAPVLGLYGQQDAGIPVEAVARMQAALAAGSPAAQASKIAVYADAPHAFHADYRPSYRAGAARNGWREMLAWLRSHGVA